MSRYHKGYRGRSRMGQSRYSAYSPGRRLFASDLEALQLLSMKYNFATAEWKTRSDKNLSDRQIKNGDNCTVSSSSLVDVNSNNLEFNSRMKLENISVIETSTCHQKAPRIDVQEEKRISDVKPFWKSNQAEQHGQMDTQSQKLKDRSFSDNVRAYLSGVADISSKHHFPTCSKSMETKTEGLKLDLAKSAVCKQESSLFMQTQNLEANSSLENIVFQSCTGTAASDSVTSSSFVTHSQNHSVLASDTAHRPSYMGQASQFHGNVLLDSHGAESKSANSFQISVPSEEISGRVKKDQQRNKEPVYFISSEGKKATNQEAVWRQLTQNTGTRSGLSVSCTASLQNSLEPVHSTFGRETCENKVCLSNTTIIENSEEIRPREPKNHFHSGNIVVTIPKLNVKSVGRMQREKTKSKKRWNNLVNSRVAKPVKISTRDPRHKRLFENNFVQHFSGLGSVLQQSYCRVGNQSQDIEDCSGKIEIEKVRKEHLTKSGHHPSCMGLASQFHGDVMLDSHGVASNPSIKVFKSESKSANSFQISVPSEEISGRVKKDQQRNKEPVYFISSEGKKATNQEAVWRQLTQNTGTRSGLSVSCTASLQNSLEPVHSTFGRETCENKVCLSNTTIIENSEEIRPREPKNHFHSGNIVVTIPKLNVKSVGRMQREKTKSKKRWNNLVNSRVAKPVKISTRDPRHKRLFENNFVQHFSGLGSVLQQSYCRVGNQSQDIEDCSGKIEIEKVRKEHLTKSGHHPSCMGLASQFHGDVMLDSHGVASNPSIKVFKSESKSANSFQISVPSEEISGRVKKDQQRNKEPVYFISSEGKKATNQEAVWRQLTQNTGTRSGLSVSCTASLQNSLEPVHSTFGRETCENKVCLSNTTIIENSEEIRPREPKNHFHSGNIVVTIPKLNVKSVGRMQREKTKSKKRWNNLVNSRVAKPVKISTRDPRHKRLFENNFVQHFSGLGSVLQQSYCRVGNQSQDIEDCSGKIEIEKVRKEHLTKSGHHPSCMGLASQFHGDVMLDSHGVASNPSIKVFKSESKSANSFQISVPSEEISGRVKKDQQRNKEPVYFISSEGKKATNQEAVWRQLTQNTGTRSGLSVSCTASLQNSLEPVHSTFGRETCENKVCLSNTTIIENSEEIRPREPKNHFHSGNIVLTIPKSNFKSVGQMQHEQTKSKKRWNNLDNSRIAKRVKISNRDPRRHGRLFGNNFVQCFSGLGSVLQQSDCRDSNQSQDIEDCSGKIEIDKTRKEQTKSGNFSGFNDINSLNVNQQSTNENSRFQESNFNYDTDSARNTIKTTYFENCNKSSAQSVSSIFNPIRKDASAMLPSNNFHVTDIQSMVNLSERRLEMSHTSSSAICYWQSVPAIFQLPVDGTPSHGLTEEEAKLINSAIAQDQDKFLDVDRYSTTDAFITNEDPENYKCLSDFLQSKNSTQISGWKDGIPHKNTFMNDHRNFSSGKMDQAIFIVKEQDYPADKDMGQSHRSELLDQGKQDKCEKLENKLSSICASYFHPKTKDTPKEDPDIETIYKCLPAVATLYKSLESNVLAVPVIRSGKEVNFHALPSAWMFLDTCSKLAPPMNSSKRESVCVTIMYNTCPRNISLMSTTPENNEPHNDCSVNDDLRSVICVDSIICGCKAMNYSDKNDKVVMSIREKDVSSYDNSNEQITLPSCANSHDQKTLPMPSCNNSHDQKTWPISSCDNSNEQNALPMPSVENSHEQKAWPMLSCDNSNEQNTQPMPLVDNLHEQNTQPMPLVDNSHEQSTQPMPSCDSSHEQNTQPMPSVDNLHEQNTQPMPLVDNSHEQSTQPMPSCDSSHEQNTQPMPSVDNLQEQNTQPMPSVDNLHEQNTQPMPSYDNSHEQKTQPMSSCDNSNEQITQTVPLCDNSHEQITQTIPSCNNSHEQIVQPMPSVDNSHEQIVQPMPSVDNSHEQIIQSMPSVDNSHEQIIQPMPSVDNSHEQIIQPMPSVDNSSVKDAHALPTVDKSCDHIEQVALFLGYSETTQGHDKMGTEDQAFHSLNIDNEDSLSKSLQLWCMNTALNIQPVQPSFSDFSSIEMQNSSKSSSEHAAVDYGDIYDLDVSGNLQPYSLEQNSPRPEKSIPLFPAHALSLDDEDRFGLDEIMYHPTADLVWKSDAAHDFHRQSDQSKNNHEDIRGNISASSTKYIKLIIEDKCETLGMTQLCGSSIFNNSERIIRNLSQPPEFAGLVENDTTLEIQTVSKEIPLDKVNNHSHNRMTRINKDNKRSEKRMDSDTDLIRDILSQEDQIHEEGNYSLIEKIPIETENRHATHVICSLYNENQSSTKTSNPSAEKGSQKSISHTRQYVRINDVLLLEAKKFIRSDILAGNKSGLNRTKLETSRKRSFRLLLKQLKASPRNAERKTLWKIKQPCTSKRRGDRQKGEKRQLNNDHGSNLVKETCENAAIATEENKENRESSIITDFSDKTYPCKDIKSQTEQLLPQIRIPENMHGYEKTGLEKEAGDKMKYGAPRRNRLAQLTDDACNAEIGERSYDSHSNSTFKDCSKTDKMDVNINLTIKASRENQMEQIPNLEDSKEALSLMVKLNERIEKPNQVCPFDDDVNLQDYISEARMEKQDTDMVSDRFIGKKQHIGVDESSKSKRSRWYCKADGPEQLRFRLERKRHIKKNFRRKLKRHHNDEDSEMAITCLKTDSSETKFKSNVSDHNEKTRGTPQEQTMKKIRTKLVFSREEFEKSKKERRLKRCVYCGEMIREVLHMIHIKKYHPHHCAQCQKAFQSKKFKSEHYLQTHVQQTYPCGPCGRNFTSKSFFERHLASAAHRHRISDILFQQVKKKSSCSKDAIRLSTEAKMSSKMDVPSDLGSFSDAASIADIVQQQSLILSLIQDQMMLGSGVDVTNLVMLQNNANSQQPLTFLNSNHTGIRVFSHTNAAMGNAFQHHSTSQPSPDLNIPYLNDTVNFDHAFVLRNDSSTYTQIGAGHGGADLSTIYCTSNYRSCHGNDSGEHGSTGQELMHFHHESSHPGQEPINFTSELNNPQGSSMATAGWLSTAINVMADDSISHDTEYNLWPDQSLRNISTKNAYSNLQSVSVAPHQMENDCLNFNQATHQSGRACLDSIEATHQSGRACLDSIEATRQSGRACLDSIEAANHSGKYSLDSIFAAKQSKYILDCKKSCINKSISENTESMNMFSSPSCSTGNEARSSCPKSVTNTNLPEFGPLDQCFYTSCNQQIIVQHDVAYNLNADNNESVDRSCEPTISAISSEALMELDPCVTSTAPIYENCLSNDYHGTSLVASISETPQLILNPSPNYRVPSEDNGVNIESDERLREQLNQILFDIELSEQQA